jgi:hypothetical protein
MLLTENPDHAIQVYEQACLPFKKAGFDEEIFGNGLRQTIATSLPRLCLETADEGESDGTFSNIEAENYSEVLQDSAVCSIREKLSGQESRDKFDHLVKKIAVRLVNLHLHFRSYSIGQMYQFRQYAVCDKIKFNAACAFVKSTESISCTCVMYE